MNLLYITHHRRFKTVARSTPLGREMVRRGHRVTLLCISDHARWAINTYSQDGIDFVETPDLLWGRLRSGWDPLSVARRMAWLSGRRFDLVHVFETRPAVIHPALRLLRQHPAPLVIDWIDWWGRGGLIVEQRPAWYRALFGGLETWYEEHFRTRGQAVTVISEALGERAAELGVPREHIHLIPDGAEPELFLPQDRQRHRASFGIPADAQVLGFSALDVTLDTGLVFAAVAEVRKTHPRAMLVMTGNPPPGIDRLAAEHGLANGGLRHLGRLPYEKLPDALSCVDVFLLPFADKVANRGRWPHKICDYMCMARPTVTNPVGEMKRLFDREPVGLLAPPEPAAFAARIAELIDDPARCETMGRHARMVVERDYLWSHIGDLAEACYRSVLPG